MSKMLPRLLMVMLTLALPLQGAAAQQWNDARTTELVTRAIDVRARQLADSMLRDYTADAQGVLTFQFQAGEGFRTPPIGLKAVQIASRLYWSSPGRSKQVLVGLRDTMLLLGDIAFYPDRYGIVQNNFPDVIRFGGNRDVSDVPHPLSRFGPGEYDYAITDSVSIVLPDQTIDVFEVRVRPKNDELPRLIGRLYIARASAAVVRMTFTFTRAAMRLDPRNEDITVTLENALVEGRFWLPWRQELYLSRVQPTFDIPMRAIIRARWQLCCYDVNLNLPVSTFVGPEIVRSSQPVLDQYKWDQEIVEALPPDFRVLTPQMVRELRAEAEQVVRARVLSPRRGAAVSASSMSDFLRVNRVEGIAPGAGISLRSGGGLTMSLGGRYGFSDREAKGRLSLRLDRPAGPTLELHAWRDYRSASLLQERSIILNSFAAPLFGSDASNPYDVISFGASIETSSLNTVRPRFELSYQKHSPVEVGFDPLNGSFHGTIPAARTHEVAAGASLLGTSSGAPFDMYLQWNVGAEFALFRARDAALSFSGPRYLRLTGGATVERPFGSSRLVLSAAGGTVHSNAELPTQRYFYLGGPVSAPGYNFNELAGKHALSTRAELRLPVPFFSISAGKYGRTPASATLAPFLSSALISSPPESSPRRSGFYPAAGIGAALFFDFLRMDVARGLRDGRWTFSFDVTREFWSIL